MFNILYNKCNTTETKNKLYVIFTTLVIRYQINQTIYGLNTRMLFVTNIDT